MSDDDNVVEEPLYINFTEQSQLRSRQIEEGYSPAQFFSEGTLHNTFITQLSTDIDQPITRIRERYSEYLAAQIQYLANDWNLDCWTNDAAQKVAGELVNQYDDDEFDAVRREYLAEATDQQLWGQTRYQFVRREFSLELLEQVGTEEFRQLVDVRPETQIEAHLPEQSVGGTKLFTVNKLNEVAVRQILKRFDITNRDVIKAALPFHSRLESDWLVSWTIENINDYSDIQKLLSDRWDSGVRYSNSLSIVEFISVLLALLNQDPSIHTIQDFIADLRDQSRKQEISAHQFTDYISDTSLVSAEDIELLDQILRGSLHPDSRPVGADADRGYTKRKTAGESERATPSFSESEIPTRMEDADRSYTRLFIIPVAGKPAEIKPREMKGGELNQLTDVKEFDQINMEYTVYAAPASQHRAVNGMSTGDIVLFATVESDYIGEYRIEQVLIAPEMVREIWDELEPEDNNQVRIPFLLVLSRPRTRRFAQQRLNQLLGYRSNSTPSHWGVAQRRVERLTDSGDSLEEILRRLDAE